MWPAVLSTAMIFFWHQYLQRRDIEAVVGQETADPYVSGASYPKDGNVEYNSNSSAYV